jgi:pyruvate dehydrogenase E2 component (dihydrolipoyllysine-residue acetyltransferase)
MPIPITIPRLGWNMDEGNFAGWLKANGETIHAGDRIFSLESEKATEEIETLDGGILHISPNGPKVGDRIEVGAIIGYLLQSGEIAPLPAETKKREVAVVSVQAESRKPKAESQRPMAASPRARRVAGELGVDWTKLQGSGSTGRIRERDVRAASAAPPVSRFRRTIAERMLTSARSTAPVTLTTMADATELVKLRGQFKAKASSVPSFTDCFIKFAAQALKQHSRLNSRWDGDRIIEETGINIGFAVDTDAGLIVPVIRDVSNLGLTNIAKQSQELIERARQGKLKPDEMRGGTFTITNLGVYAIDAFTPIINYPECAILGIGRIAKQPVVIGDEIAIREVVTLSLTFDHRIVDGAPAALFLQSLAGLIEDPASSLT